MILCRSALRVPAALVAACALDASVPAAQETEDGFRALRARPAESRPSDDRVLQFYDVRDLLPEEEEDPALEEKINSLFPEKPASDPAELLLLVVQEIAAVAGTGAECRAVNGALVVHAEETVHQQVQRFLQFLRKERAPQVMVEVQLIHTNERLCAWLRESGVQLPPDPLAKSVPYECDAEFRAGLLHAAKELGADILASPHLLTFPIQRATISIVHQIGVVRGYEVVNVAGGESVVDPQIEAISDGFSMNLRAVFGPPDEEGHVTCAVDLDAIHREILQPIATVETEHGIVHAPEVVSHLHSTTTLIHHGHDLLLVAPPLPAREEDENRRMLLLLHVRPVEFGEEQPNEGDGVRPPRDGRDL